MKLINFKAEDVYGYLNFNVIFNDDITFLVGVNGSGKSTVLLLMQALLTPSIIDLIYIPFTNASVEIEDKKEKKLISAWKIKNSLLVTITGIDDKLVYPLIDQKEIEYIVQTENKKSSFIEELQLKFNSNDVFKSILNINAPVFLGLERIHKIENESNHLIDRDFIVSRSMVKNGFRSKRIVKGSLAAGLMETQLLVMEAYRRMRRKEEFQSTRLREDILLSSFRYYDYDLDFKNVKEVISGWGDAKKIQDKKVELEKILIKSGFSREKIFNVLDDFFSKIEILINSIIVLNNSNGEKDYDCDNESKMQLPFEILINKSQIERAAEMIKIIENNKNKIDIIYEKITTFIDTLNSFFKDTKKSIEIDTVGQLSVKMPNGRIADIDALSSGERQLLIMFSHLLFNEFGNRSNIFIIDEPELSLHLRWQELFVPKMVSICKDAQLIMATHSPEIVANYINNSITLH